MTLVSLVSGGPGLPVEILHSFREERLVFFCGAGISMPDLPSFRGLTLEAIHAARLPVDVDGLPRDEAIRDAFCRELYDKALDILERSVQGSSGQLRQFVRTRLTRDLADGHTTDLHGALLDLARLRPGRDGGPRGYRLVTTNFDNRFELARPEIRGRWTRAAPLLSRPSPTALHHVTFLHGRIETEQDPLDPECRSLVLTSADFGEAYLRDGYAARFVLELFSEFTVVFVGYGLNDPVMRYLMDAFAAERARGGRFREAYAFASEKGNPKLQDALWRSKSVVPILYRELHDSNPHRLLEETVVEWARRHRAGLDGYKVVFAEALRPFQPATDQVEPQESLTNLAWTLAQNEGLVAEHFASYSELRSDGSNTRPDISWLGPILTCRLKDPSVPSGDESKKYCLADLPLPSFQLSRWAMGYLSDRRLVKWAIENETLLSSGRAFAKAFHDTLYREVEKLKDQLAEPYQSFWRLLILALDGTSSADPWSLLWEVHSSNGIFGDRARVVLASMLAPSLKWPRPFLRFDSRPDLVECVPAKIADLADFDVMIGPGHSADILLPKLKDRTRVSLIGLLSIADELTTCIARACDLGRAAGDGFATGYSHVYRPTIARVEDEERHGNRSRVIDLLIEAFDYAALDKCSVAIGISRRWLSIWEMHGHALLLRFYLYSSSFAAVASIADVEDILQRVPDALWESEYNAEILRTLQARAKDLPSTPDRGVFARILAGPCMRWLEEAPPHRAARYRLELIAGRLEALQLGGMSLPPEAELILAERERARLADAAPPSQAVMSVDQLTTASTDVIVQQIGHRADEHGFSSDWQAGRDVAEILRLRPDRSFEMVEGLSQGGETRSEVWASVFGRLGEMSSDPAVLRQVDGIVGLLERAPELPQRGSIALARWVRALVDHLEDDDMFWRVFDVTLRTADGGSSVIKEDTELDSLTIALNSSCGVLAECVLRRQWKAGVSAGQGLGEPYRRRLNHLMRIGGRCGTLARAMCMPWLASLFWLDPKWTEDNLLAHMHVGADGTSEAITLWRSYLFRPRIPWPLFDLLKIDFISLLSDCCRLGEDAYMSACDVFADIVVARPHAFTEAETRDALDRLGAVGSRRLLYRFGVRLDRSDNPDGLWITTLGPWLDDNWPSTRQYRDLSLQNAAARLLLQTRQAFPVALASLERHGLVGEVENAGTLLYQLSHANNEGATDEVRVYDYVLHHPGGICRWLAAALPVHLGYERSYLKAILERIIEPALGTPEHECWKQLWQRLGGPP